MNQSIRILNISETFIQALENRGVFTIADLLRTPLEELPLPETDRIQLSETVKQHKIRQLKKELRGAKAPCPYAYLDRLYQIDSLGLPLRSYNALMNHGINTISKLIWAIEDLEIYHIDSLGAKSIIQVMKHVREISEKEELHKLIPLFQNRHALDRLTVSQMGFSQGAVTSLSNLHLNTLGDIRKAYLSGELAQHFNYKTLKVVIDELAQYFADKSLDELNYLKQYLIEEKLGEISLEDLPHLLPGFSFDVPRLLALIKNRKDIILLSDRIRLPYLIEKLQEIGFRTETESILMERFSGRTLQAIADRFHKTRERIRQIVRDRMDKLSMYYEEAFVKEYNKYLWHPEVFRKVFGLNSFSYYVVKYLGKKYSFEEEYVFPEEYLKQLFENKIVPAFDIEAMKIAMPEVFHPQMDIYGKSVMKMTKRGFLEYVIEHHIPENGFHKSKIVALANKIAAENGLSYTYDKFIDIVTNTVQGLQNVRYYDYSRITEDDLIELKNIVRSVNSVYSCTYFYRNNPVLMQRLDIRDGYELHFLLRRFFAKSPEFANTIDFNRQPMIAVKGKSFTDLIYEKWQETGRAIPLDEFAKELINDFGFHAGTLINMINAALGDYISLKVLYPKKPSLTPEVLEKIRALMTDDFYELSELTEILQAHGIQKEDYQYFSNFWLKDLGYKTHDVNYIIKETFTSLKDVFYSRVLKDPVYTLTEKDHKMRETTLILFIESMRQDFLAFLGQNETLYTMKYLASEGIQEEDLRVYVKALAEYLPKEEYFTYTSLLKNHYYLDNPVFEKVEKYHLEKPILIDLIRNVPNIKKTTKGDLFRISSRPTTVSEFAEDIAKKYAIADRKNLKKFIRENYGINIRNYEM